MTLLENIDKMLLQAATEAMKNAYVLWGFKVGAAVLAEDGKIYEGCNVESWISGFGICAERCAVNHAVLHGNTRIKEVALVMDRDNGKTPRPCGACLQYINDFAENPQIKIVMAKANNAKYCLKLSKLNFLRNCCLFPSENEVVFAVNVAVKLNSQLVEH